MRAGRLPMSPRRRSGGMTMVELMVAMTIMTALIAVAFPVMRGFNERNRLRAAAREMVGLMKYARAEAVLGQRITSVVLDLEKREFRLHLPQPEGEKRTTGGAKPKKSLFEQPRPLHRDLWFEEVTTVEDNVIDGKVIVVDFFPDGSASPTLITLANRNNRRITIEVLKPTGLTEVTNGSVADKKAAAAENRASCPKCEAGGAPAV
jgi:type II secretion system protein H